VPSRGVTLLQYQSLEDLQLQPYDAEKAATLERGMLLEYLKEDGQRKRKIEQSEVQIQVQCVAR
jgi:hypothetical protein